MNPLIVIANREPYVHQNSSCAHEALRPASGLVTALEPILRASGGLWVAHGSGAFDPLTVDAKGEIAVPPHDPTYRLRRLFLTPQEEAGYYSGFSNEGLWPLCHLAHNRPVFRLSDWQQYKTVNFKFSSALRRTDLQQNPLILVQDYHFALVPRILKEIHLETQLQVGLFWHIPWPNPEIFGICPWAKELLSGLLGADLIGFHTQAYCNNFLATCDRYLEARVDWEHFSVHRENHSTSVRAFPIGIQPEPVTDLSPLEISKLKKKYGIHCDLLAVGVDRLDYTKGIPERVEAVERFLEKYPAYQGRFALVQIAAPSRSHLPAYQSLEQHLKQLIQRVNERFRSSDGKYQPIYFLNEHFNWDQLQQFYQLGDLCLVTSLHDGMNLVAKEYVWCQKPHQGALILSQFTGACQELTEAWIVNPYSPEQVADAMAHALRMPHQERSQRMQSMKQKVQNQSALHWGQQMVSALKKT
ncbi:MAG: alpha,alpha-trehalose-phosphate synthase (UDP-forming) [Bdellovibrionia bacterium]